MLWVPQCLCLKGCCYQHRLIPLVTILKRCCFQQNRLNQMKWLSGLGSDKLYSTKKQTCWLEMNIPQSLSLYMTHGTSHVMALCPQSHDLSHMGHEKLEVIGHGFVSIPLMTNSIASKSGILQTAFAWNFICCDEFLCQQYMQVVALIQLGCWREQVQSLCTQNDFRV